MKTIYFDCAMGAAGDMLMAALWELLPERDPFLEEMNALGLPGITVSAEKSVKCGIAGTHMRVLVHGEEEGQGHAAHDAHGHHAHAGLAEITALISGLALPEAVREDALAVFRSIAEAESRVHGAPVDQIHFHEVGSLDALADVVGVCLLMHKLAPEQVCASAVHAGSGQVKCAHGILPVPAPATALLLEGIPCYGGEVRGELCTPTGAALLRRFVTKFGPMPQMCVEKIGYGMGKKDFDAANCVRAMLGQTGNGTEQIVELCCNLDDMTAEDIAFAMERLFDAGAVDVYTTAVGMKKNRPGTLLTCMCREREREKLIRALFRYTTTLGVRESVCERRTLQREERVCRTADGDVRVKMVRGYGVERSKAEYEDLARIARQSGKSLAEVREMLEK